jgi:hypothetical protein
LDLLPISDCWGKKKRKEEREGGKERERKERKRKEREEGRKKERKKRPDTFKIRYIILISHFQLGAFALQGTFDRIYR